MSDLILKARHRSVVTMVGSALTLETDTDAWRAVTEVLLVRLSPLERANLAVVCLNATDDEEFFEIVETRIPSRSAGAPLPPLLDAEDEARWWASVASPSEVKAWLLACFAQLPIRERRAFLHAASRRVAA
jgi:hypothetical protein